MFSSGFFLTMSYKIYQEMKQKTNQWFFKHLNSVKCLQI
jgi:hypothetical protein